MPRYAKKRTYRKKKTYKKNRKVKPKMSKITSSKSNTLSTDHTFVKMTWADNSSNFIKLALGNVRAGKCFCGNTIYQPNGSATGTPALGYYEYKSLYNKYRVLGSKITVNWFAPTGITDPNDESFYRCTLVPVDIANISAASITHASELPYAKTIILSPLNAGNGSRVTQSHYISTCKIEGSMAPKTDISFASIFGQNPKNMFFWFVNIAKMNGIGASEDLKIGCEIRITYYVELYSRIDNAFDEPASITYAYNLFDQTDGTPSANTKEPEAEGPSFFD